MATMTTWLVFSVISKHLCPILAWVPADISSSPLLLLLLLLFFCNRGGWL
jgi:hypothetical protein